ncbi:MAG TPA: response regulator [Candidatus Aquabacterium excrementipullorum]|nr:response regulator [Candidatus Aquabacterium excrementipullorum]
MLSLQEQAGLEDQVRAARLRMLLDHVEVALLASGVFAAVVAWLIHHMVPEARLWPWLVLKLICLVPRLAHAKWLSRRVGDADVDIPKARRLMLAFIALDSLAWGAAGWWLTPLHHLDLAVVTLSSLMGLAAIGAFMNSVDTRAVACFMLPMLLPNVAFVLWRQDSLGLFGAASMLGFLGVMMLETVRSQRRVTELLRLRFMHEHVAGERARALEQARHHSDARSRFLATVSHEMRTPLHGILGLARVLQQDKPRADQRQRLALMARSGEHLLTVINDILDFSKIEAGRMGIESRPFDLNEVLDEVVGVFQVLAQRKQVSLRQLRHWEGDCPVVGDAARVRQVLNNLLGNAVKFTDHGSIQLIARRHADGVVELQVRDTGAGIAEADRERIFDAFTQSHAASSAVLDRQHGGTGLGLSIARQLCRAMDGDLVCDSAVGVGSIFKATMRLASQAADDRAVAPADTAHGEGSLAGLRVLLAEDNPVNILVAEAVLGHLGCAVHTVTDGQQAVAWLAQQPACDVVLMDCAMPVMNGLEATREIRRHEQMQGRARVPIIALTANSLLDERAQCLDAGMDEHLPKPFGPDDIRAVLERVLLHRAVNAS